MFKLKIIELREDIHDNEEWKMANCVALSLAIIIKLDLPVY